MGAVPPKRHQHKRLTRTNLRYASHGIPAVFPAGPAYLTTCAMRNPSLPSWQYQSALLREEETRIESINDDAVPQYIEFVNYNFPYIAVYCKTMCGNNTALRPRLYLSSTSANSMQREYVLIRTVSQMIRSNGYSNAYKLYFRKFLYAVAPR